MRSAHGSGCDGLCDCNSEAEASGDDRQGRGHSGFLLVHIHGVAASLENTGW